MAHLPKRREEQSLKNNEYFHLGGVLLAITAAVALLLGFFNNLTADVIAATKEENERLSMQSVMPNASSFETIRPIRIWSFS